MYSLTRVFGLFVLLSGNTAFASQKTPVIVELFTSQGCSSCPRADAVLGELSHSGNVIALACHVSYWDYLGWKDTFSLPACDSRQQRYSGWMKRHGVYTPQMIINGRYQALGSQKSQVASAVATAAEDEPLLNFSVTVHDKALEFDFRNLNLPGRFQLSVFGVGATQTVAISRGENEGRSISYHNPVLVYFESDLATTKTSILSLRMYDTSKVKRWVALLQDTAKGQIVAVGTTAIIHSK